VTFLQNHDQVGNRAFGERISMLTSADALRCAAAVLLMAPSPPLLFMGEEFASTRPFAFFCDFGPDLAAAVTEGRRNEFARFERFQDPATRQSIPDPNDPATFQAAKLDWDSLLEPEREAWHALYGHLLKLRRREIIPRLKGIGGAAGEFQPIGDKGLTASWQLGDGSRLLLLANLGKLPLPLMDLDYPTGTPLYSDPEGLAAGLAARRLPAWSVGWFLAMAEEERGT
jgi:maltooligosyltrehalose trehalohydrolase